jgi:hypothetical protein
VLRCYCGFGEARALTVHNSVLHHEVDFRGNLNVCDWITGHGNDIGELTGGEHPEVITPRQRWWLLSGREPG